MHLLDTFRQWLTSSSEKTEKFAFKNEREAAEFVRRVYNENGSPNRHLKALYKEGKELRARAR